MICTSRSKEVMELLKALGLEKNCVSLTIKIVPDDLVRVTVERLLTKEDVTTLGSFAVNHVLDRPPTYTSEYILRGR